MITPTEIRQYLANFGIYPTSINIEDNSSYQDRGFIVNINGDDLFWFQNGEQAPEVAYQISEMANGKYHR